MKKTLTAITAAIFFLIPALCFSAYLIQLKDGRQFTTDRYWEDGDQIKFKRYGGEVGISRDLVKKIEVIEAVEDAPKRDEGGASNTPAKPETSQTEGEKAHLAPKKEGGAKQNEGLDSESVDESSVGEKDGNKNELKDETYYMEKKAALEVELKNALERYKTAKAAGEEERIREAFRLATSLATELEELKKEVKRQNYGYLPDWWHSGP